MAKKLSNQAIIEITNMDERKFAKYRISFYKKEPDILVLGSSRSMQIKESKTTGNLLNLSVSGASVEDQITLGVLAMQKFKPKHVILCADPWLFNENSNQKRYLSLRDEYITSMSLISQKDSNFQNFDFNEKDLIHANITYKIYSKVNVNFLNSTKIDEQPGILDKIRSDGSRIYNFKYYNRKYDSYKNEFQNNFNYSMNNYKFSKKYFNDYLLFIDYLKSKKVKVFLLLSPYHPLLYNTLIKNNSNYIFALNRVKEISNIKNLNVIGSYDPYLCSCNDLDFYDGMHPKDDCINSIIF